MSWSASATRGETAARPRLWVVSELYYPEQTSTGYFLTGIAEGLADSFDVHAVCGQPTYSSAGTVAPRRGQRHGVSIFRMRGTRFPKDRLVLRLFNVVTLTLATFFFLLRHVRSGDRILAVTNPPTMPPLLALVIKLRRARGVLLVHDVYPEVLVAAGMLSRRSLVVQVMARVMKAAIAAFDHVIVLGEDMAELVSNNRGIAPERMSIIPNWGDTAAIVPADISVNAIARQLGAQSKTIIQYSGNIGRTHDIELVLDVARRLEGRDDILFLFAGEGGKMPLVEAEARKTGSNIVVLPRQPAESLPELLSCATATIIALPPGMTGISVPSRMYNVMAAARPIISVGDKGSTLSNTVRDNDAGWYCDADPASLQSQIEEIATPEGHGVAKTKGVNARRLVESRYTRGAVVGQFLSLMKAIA